MRRPIITRSFLSVALFGTMLATAACEPHVAHRGTMPDVDVIASIVPQESTRDDVERMLGSPSSVNVFGQETWMYIGETTEQLAFFEREVNERSVLLVHFDDKGVVTAVEANGVEAGRNIQPVERTTPTVGKKITVIEQLVGNLNRFGKTGR